jgi:ribosomal protein S1
MQHKKPKSKAATEGAATHEFFPKSRGAEKKGGLIFNKAPINKQLAYQETKAKVMHDQEDAKN